MSKIKFSDDEKRILADKIQHFMREEHDLELGRFGAEFLLEFFSREIGPYFYNQGLYDARTVLMGKIEDVTDSIYQIELPTEFSK